MITKNVILINRNVKNNIFSSTAGYEYNQMKEHRVMQYEPLERWNRTRMDKELMTTANKDSYPIFFWEKNITNLSTDT